MNTYQTLVLCVAICISCQPPNTGHDSVATVSPLPGNFLYDQEFLGEKDSIILLTNEEGNGQVIVSPKYQGKVFTSTAEGPAGKSFGWINYAAFDGPQDPHMNAYGGENRLWLGPEGSMFSLFFPPDAEMTFEQWKTPAAIDTQPWTLVSSNDKMVSMNKYMELQNYGGTSFELSIDRDVEILETPMIEQTLGIALNQRTKAVAFRTSNVITNKGEHEWTRETGAPCMWILDMLSPSNETTVIIPYRTSGTGKIATTNYFGEIPNDRIHIANGILVFRADGRSRGKLGLSPNRAKPVAGSYDAINQVLTITTFDIDSTAVYLNQEWTTSKDPFDGDAVNAYNDGPLENGQQMGPFYEIESVSPAAFLKPGEKLSHNHSVFHFTGDKGELDKIAVTLLGISLNEITSALRSDQ